MNDRAVRAHLAAMQGRHVAVIGDAMLDAFLWGDATRISPEAPVPVVLLEKQTWSLGGAANVAANIAALGGRAVLFSMTGRDSAGARVRRMAARAGIVTESLFALAGRPTTIKYRVFARNKHLLRCDRETAEPVPAQLVRRVLAGLEARRDLDAVVLSDYAKGTVTAELARGVARLCAARKLPLCVDPKTASLRYRHATILKPNRLELEALSGMAVHSLEDLRQAAGLVLRRHPCRYVLVTRGELGMALFGTDGSERLLDGFGHAVADVTGAGDTVSAVVGLGLAAGLAVPEVAELANRAGAFVVSQAGITVVRPENLA